MLLPPSLEELIGKTHAVRVVNSAIDKDRHRPTGGYVQGRRHLELSPGYVAENSGVCIPEQRIPRAIEAAVKENIHFMWLAGMKRPDHNTINRFRGQRLKKHIKEVFTQVVLLLMEAGHVDLKAVYTDGTKLEANANKYTFVWGKSIQTNKKKMKAQLEELWNYTQQVAAEELKGDDPGEMQEIDPEKVERTIEAINTALQGKEVIPR